MTESEKSELNEAKPLQEINRALVELALLAEHMIDDLPNIDDDAHYEQGLDHIDWTTLTAAQREVILAALTPKKLKRLVEVAEEVFGMASSIRSVVKHLSAAEGNPADESTEPPATADETAN